MVQPTAKPNPVSSPRRDVTMARWLAGMLIASFFCLVYLVTPIYILIAFSLLLFRFQLSSLVFAAPIFLSILVPPIGSKTVLRWLDPLCDYFDFEQIVERMDLRNKMLRDPEGTNYIIALQPHGVLSFCGICAAIRAEEAFQVELPTAVASAVLKTPIIKNVMGIFGLVDASASSIRKILRKKGIRGSVAIYVGGMAELFKSSRKEERLFLSKRKGFIKIALREGVDVVPVYLFGNTSVLSVVKTGFLANLSRKWQVSLTYFWGKHGLPIPRDEKLLYCSGSPLGMPHISEPTQEDVDRWHGKYCQEVTRLFDTYKERVPMYKHKTLIID